MFNTILIANRGEIACRIIKTAKRLGIKTVAVYSDADEHALHVRCADQAVHIGAAPAAESYLLGDKIIEAAKATGAQAVHPGYGFLSENAGFARLCAENDIVFIGPSPEAIEKMGLKDRAKDIMQDANVPVVPGYQGENQDAGFLKAEADKIGYPVLIKAVAGGGGKGMRRIDHENDFAEQLASCQREAKAAFGNDAVLIEKYIGKPRHIEVQIFGDNHGNYAHLFERDCSVQRRHQKVVEEAPAPGVDEKLRAEIGAMAVRAAEAIDYSGAGTIEFIVNAEGTLSADDFYFMEMNTRLQVEHPVSEMISGQDFVEWQLRIAAGETLPKSQDQLSIQGHAVELRIYAEDPAADFVPQIGTISHVFDGDSSGTLRLDSGVEAGDAVSVYYDPMIAKLICWGESREVALNKMQRQLCAAGFIGVNNNQEYLRNIIAHPAFLSADLHTHFIEQYQGDLIGADFANAGVEDYAMAALFYACNLGGADEAVNDPWSQRDHWRSAAPVRTNVKLKHHGEFTDIALIGEGGNYQITVKGTSIDAHLIESAEPSFSFSINGKAYHVQIIEDKLRGVLALLSGGRILEFAKDSFALHGADDGAGEGRITSPMPGTIIKILVEEGAKVEKDQPLIIMEAMKLEMTLRAPRHGVIEALHHGENDQVNDGALLLELTAEEAA